MDHDGSYRKLRMPWMVATVAAALTFLLMGVGTAQALTGGPEIQVNTTIADIQNSPAVASDEDGNFTVAWHSRNQDGSERGIYARRFDSGGDPLTDEIPVNATTAGDQAVPEIAPDGSGGFTVVWHDLGGDGGDRGIDARRFDSDGDPLTGDIQVNTSTSGTLQDVSIAPDPGGGFSVAWANQDPHGLDHVFVRRFDSDGNPLTGEIPVNATTATSGVRPEIAPDGSGGFTVSWDTSDGDATGVYARRFDSDGDPLTGEIQVNTTTAGFQRFSAISQVVSGGFVVAWQSADADSIGIFMRRFDSDGDPLTGEIPVNATTARAQLNPDIAPDPGGGFTAAWESFDQDGDAYGVYMRRFDSDGDPLTGEIQVNTTTADTQEAPSIVPDGHGGLTVAWRSDNQDGDDLGIFARRFFESLMIPPPGLPTPDVSPPLPDHVIELLIARRALLHHGAAWMGLRCPATEKSPPCRGRVILRTARLRIGRGRDAKRRLVLARGAYRIASGQTRVLRMRIGRRKLRLLLRRPRARRVASIAGVRDAAGNREVVRRRLRIVPVRKGARQRGRQGSGRGRGR